MVDFVGLLEGEMETLSNVRVARHTFSLFVFLLLLLFHFSSVAVNELAIKMTAFERYEGYLSSRALCPSCVTIRRSLFRARRLNNPKISSLVLLNSLLSFKSKIHFTSCHFLYKFPDNFPSWFPRRPPSILNSAKETRAWKPFLTTVQTHDYFSC